MAELARGTVRDRPWGLTFGALGTRGLTGQLTLVSEGREYCVAFVQGAVVAASSPLANDSAVRIAITGGLVSSTQVGEVARRLAAAPGRDEIDVLSEIVRLGPEQAQRLRRRAVAQRAARTFSLEQGEFIVDDRIQLPVVPGNELDVRALIYLGAKANLAESRLIDELAGLGGWFRLKPEAVADLAQFGFGPAEAPALQLLQQGAAPDDLAAATPELDGHGIRAMVYALISCGACDVRPASRRDAPPTDQPLARGMERRRPPTAPRLRTSSSSPPPLASAEPAAGSDGIRVRTPSAPPATARTPTRQPTVARTATGARTRTPSFQPATVPTVSRTGSPQLPQPPRTATGNVAPPIGRTPTPGQPNRAATPNRPATPTRPPTPRPSTGSNPPPSVARTTTATAGRARRPSVAVVETQQLIGELLPQLDAGADHFALLGVAFDAPPDAVRNAYLMLARKLHPDRLTALGIADPQRDAQRLFAQINTAFAVLGDPSRREEYVELQHRGGAAAVREDDAKAEEMALAIMRAEEAFRRGEMALRRDQLAQAVAEFTSAVELQPNEPDYQALLAWAKFAAAPDKAGLANPTRNALLRAAESTSESVTARFYLGRVERMLGREREALAHFQEVLRLKPGHSEASSEARILEQRLKGRR